MVHDIIAARVVLTVVVTVAMPATAAGAPRCPEGPSGSSVRVRCPSVSVPLDQSGALPGAVRIRAAGSCGRAARPPARPWSRSPAGRCRRACAAIGGSEPVSRFSAAVFAATLWRGGVGAWERSADPATRRARAVAALSLTPDAAFAPFDRAAALTAGLLTMCGDRPAPQRAAALTPPLPRVPALVLSGLDMRTPRENARAVVAALPGARRLVERAVGHAVLGADRRGCATPAVRAFLADRPLPRCARGG